MKSFLVALGLVFAAGLAFAQEADQSQFPKLTVVIPQGVDGTHSHVDYFLYGSFGGNEAIAEVDNTKRRYEIELGKDGEPADGLKGFAYMPACGFAKFQWKSGAKSKEIDLTCKPLPSVTVEGNFSSSVLPKEGSAELHVIYLADWAMDYYGIKDGSAPMVEVATVQPDADGHFSVLVPDFAKRPELTKGSLVFMLRDPATNNLLAQLKPSSVDDSTDGFSLEIRPNYGVIQFDADLEPQPPPKPAEKSRTP